MAPFAFGKSFGMQVNTTRAERGGRIEVTVDVIVTADEDGNPISSSGGEDAATTNLPRQQLPSNLARPGCALVVLSTSKRPRGRLGVSTRAGGRIGTSGDCPGPPS